MVNYTFGDGYKKINDFEIKPSSGDICISGNLDFERRSAYEFPIIATDRGECHLWRLTIYVVNGPPSERVVNGEWAAKKNVKCAVRTSVSNFVCFFS